MPLAVTYAALGDKETAFRWLWRAREERLHTISLLKVEPGFEPLRSDPRLAELLRSVGLQTP
jgi:hypothetical protein